MNGDQRISEEAEEKVHELVRRQLSKQALFPPSLFVCLFVFPPILFFGIQSAHQRGGEGGWRRTGSGL